MRRSSAYGVIVMCLSLSGALVRAQTQIDARTQTKNIDFSRAVSTKPVKTGVDLPSSCSAGELAIKLSDTAGKYLYICAAADTWMSWSTQSGLPPVAGQADSVLSNDGTAAAWRTIGGDVNGPPQGQRVTGLQSHPVGNAAPSDSDILVWDSALNQWTPKRYWFSQLSGQASNAQLPPSPSFVSVSTGDGSTAGEIKLYEAPANGSYSVSLAAPDNLDAVYRYIMPAGAPAANQLLQAASAPDSNGVVAMRWATAAGGLADPGANGVLKRTAAGTTAIATGADLPVMGASGAAHSAGAAPDPGAAAGTTRFLREDGTWSAPASGAAMFDPHDDDKYWFYEDCATGTASSGHIGGGAMATALVGAGGSLSFPNLAAAPMPGHPGVCSLSTGTDQNTGISLVTGSSGWSYPFNAADLSGSAVSWKYSSVFRFPAGTGVSSVRFRAGILNDVGNLSPASGAFVRYDTSAPASDSVFRFVTCNGGSCTSYDTGVTPAVDTWYKVTIVYTASTQMMTFQLNAGAPATFCSSGCNQSLSLPNATNVALTAGVMLGTGTTASRSVYIDRIAFSMQGLGGRY